MFVGRVLFCRALAISVVCLAIQYLKYTRRLWMRVATYALRDVLSTCRALRLFSSMKEGPPHELLLFGRLDGYTKVRNSAGGQDDEKDPDGSPCRMYREECTGSGTHPGMKILE